MSNFPSKWFDFSNHKELRRLHQDLNNSFSLKLEIAISIMLTIFSLFFEEKIHDWTLCTQIITYVCICLIIAVVFLWSSICAWYRNRKRSNVFIGKKDAVRIFDDEIVYSVLVACEYFDARKNTQNKELKAELEKFYDIEIKYYVTESIKRLVQFTSNLPGIIGSDNGRIPMERMDNIVNMLDELIIKSQITIDESLTPKYERFKTKLRTGITAP